MWIIIDPSNNTFCYQIDDDNFYLIEFENKELNNSYLFGVVSQFDDDFEAVEELLLKFNGLVVIDEAYIDFSAQKSCKSLFAR